MALRHPVRYITLSAALAVGAAAMPATANAEHASHATPRVFIAPLSAPVPHVSPATIGKDALAGSAASALDAWAVYAANGDHASLEHFAALRDSIAASAATRLKLDPTAMQNAWRNADSKHQLALLTAFTQLGVPYRAYVRKPGIGFDCSGITGWAWEQAGVVMPRNSRAQIRAIKSVTPSSAQAGDLVWYPGHVMMYLGVADSIVHAPQRGRTISLDTLPKHHRFVKYGNPLG